MKTTVLNGRELTDAQRQRWREIQAMSPVFGSPYFCVEFTEAVAAARDDVYVAVIEQKEEIVAFFPFQRARGGFGKPVGGPLCDIHGVLAIPDYQGDFAQLLADCGLVTWAFHCAPADQAALAPHAQRKDESLYLDLSSGFDAYVEAMKERGAKAVNDCAYKMRKLGRDHGEVRFEPHIEDVGILDTLIAWKSAQYQASGLIDVFSFEWTQKLLKTIHATDTPDFRGRFCGLYAGDQLVAMHMGMMSRTVVNWWFPRHDNAFRKYSPGILLRWLAAEHAANRGIQRMDLGCADETSYKQHLATGGIPVMAGEVRRPSVAVAARDAWSTLQAKVRASPIKKLLGTPGRRLAAAIYRSRYK
jgi:CelD/BcsL family acetyltransferase involved in cellulose biosynthesis